MQIFRTIQISVKTIQNTSRIINRSIKEINLRDSLDANFQRNSIFHRTRRSVSNFSIDSRRTKRKTRCQSKRRPKRCEAYSRSEERFRGAASACRSRGSFFFLSVAPWEKSSLDRPALPPPLPSLQKRNRTIKRSRVGREAARNGNTSDRSADLLVFVPVLRGFSHTREHQRLYSRSCARAQIPRCTYALDRLVCPFERVTGLIATLRWNFLCS